MCSPLAPAPPLTYNDCVDSQATLVTSPQEIARPLDRSRGLCVFTALFGGYELLNEQPMAQQSDIPFVCFTDDPELRSETWQMRLISPLFAMDPARSQRDFKLRPHVHLAEFDTSLYIDNAVVLSRPPEEIFERYITASGFALAKNELRQTVLDEFLEVARRGYDDPSRVFEQLNHYTLTCPEVLEERPYWGGILVRDHREPAVRAMLDIWCANVMRYSRRDQLSLNASFKQSGLVPEDMDIDNYSSWFHTWPHTPGRDRKKGTLSSAVSFSPPIARVRQLEQQIAEMQKKRDDLLQTEAWGVGNWLKDSAGRHPRLVGPVFRSLRRLSQRVRPH